MYRPAIAALLATLTRGAPEIPAFVYVTDTATFERIASGDSHALIVPGQHINADAQDQVNDFPSLFVIINAGTASARFGGREMALEDNQVVFVPAGMSHEFWNPGDGRATSF